MKKARGQRSEVRRTAGSGLARVLVLVLVLVPRTRGDDTPVDTSSPPNPQSAIRNPQSPSPTVTTATRTPLPYQDVPSSTTVIGGDEVEALAAPVLTESLQGVPGVDVARNGPPGQPTSLFLRGTNSNHVKFLLDGIDISDPSSPNGIPLLDHLVGPGTGQIEVIRGPQSALYGSEAIGGVVQALTRSARSGPFGASYEAEGGSFYTSRQRLTLEGAGRSINGLLAFSYFDTAGFSASSAGVERDPYRNAHLTTRLSFEPTEIFRVETVLHYIRAQTEFDLFGSDDPLNQTDSDQIFAKIEPQLHLFDGRWVSRLNLNTGIQDRDTFNRFFVGDIYHRDTYEGQSYTGDWQNDIKVFEWNLLTVGAGLRHERTSATVGRRAGFPSGFVPPSSSTSDRDVVGIYAQDQITLWDDRIHIVPGIRHDRYSDFGDQTTWRVAGSYRHLETGTTARGSYGTGFKAPTLAELFDPAFSNRNLDAERSTGWDAGVEQEVWRDRASVGAIYFHNEIDDLIQAVFVPAVLNFVPRNIGQARTQGVEAFAMVRPSQGWYIRPSYTYTETKDLDTGSRLLRRPLHKAGLEVVGKFLDERATLGIGAFYVGQREDFSPRTFGVVTNDDYWLVRISGAYKITRNVEVTGRIENALDEHYEDVLGFTSPGLSAYGGIRFTY